MTRSPLLRRLATADKWLLWMLMETDVEVLVYLSLAAVLAGYWFAIPWIFWIGIAGLALRAMLFLAVAGFTCWAMISYPLTVWRTWHILRPAQRLFAAAMSILFIASFLLITGSVVYLLIFWLQGGELLPKNR